MNKTLLLGNLTKDPEIGTTQSGIQYARFSIAVQRKYANEDGKRDVDFINCVAWRQTADIVGKWFKKGKKMLLVGSIQTRQYDAQDGSKRTATDVIVDEVYFADQQEKKEEPKPQFAPRQVKITAFEDDDLPF